MDEALSCSSLPCREAAAYLARVSYDGVPSLVKRLCPQHLAELMHRQEVVAELTVGTVLALAEAVVG
ncbi:MAG TPA: hypothetical protein VI452_03370 [Marmoricola sp.]|nr:hypothetical protein [Terrabacter sp.]